MRSEHDNPLDSVNSTEPPPLHKSRTPITHTFELIQASASPSTDHAENRDNVAAESERDGVMDGFCDCINEIDLQEVPRSIEGAFRDFTVGLGSGNGNKCLSEMDTFR